MGHPFDPADTEPDDSIVALLDALADTETDSDQYPPTEEDLQDAERLARLEFDLAARTTTNQKRPAAILAEVVVEEVESWLAGNPVDLVRARGPVSMPTVDRVVPELADAGYMVGVEIDADVDEKAVVVSVQLTATAESPASLIMRVVDSADVVHSAKVNRYGLATVTDVAPGRFRIMWLEIRETT